MRRWLLMGVPMLLTLAFALLAITSIAVQVDAGQPVTAPIQKLAVIASAPQGREAISSLQRRDCFGPSGLAMTERAFLCSGISPSGDMNSQSGQLVVTSSSPTALSEITTLTATVTVPGVFTCTWELGDGTPAAGYVVLHTYPTVGRYTAMVTATDGIVTYVQTTTVSVDIPVASPLLSEGFEGLWLPMGWSSSILTPSLLWQHSSSRAYRGAYSAFHDDAFGMQDAWLVTRRVTPTAESQLVFWQFERYAPYYYRHSVWASTGSPDPKDGDYVELAQVMTGTESTWEQVSVSLGAFAGQPHYLAFRYQGNNADEWTLDDVRVTTALVASHNGPKQPGEIVTFMAYVPTGSNVEYIWNLGEGVIRSGATVTHAYGAVGSYTAVVTASNSVNSVTEALTVPIGMYSYLPLVIRP